MTPEQLFAISNPAAAVGWLILVFAGRRRWAAGVVAGAVIPMLFAVLYVALLFGHWGEGEGSFNTLSGVQQLFQNPWLLLAGWIHYLAFDLFIGSWQVRDAARHAIPHLLVIPCLVLTFLFGPFGLLAYMAIRGWRTRRVAIDEPSPEAPAVV